MMRGNLNKEHIDTIADWWEQKINFRCARTSLARSEAASDAGACSTVNEFSSLSHRPAPYVTPIKRMIFLK